MKTRLTILALMASLLIAACSEGPDNDQITAVPPKSENSSNTTLQDGPAATTPARVELPEVPAPAAEERVLDDVLDNTGE